MKISEQDKDYICKLIQNANKLSTGELISDIVALHKWSQISSGFDSRFLANIFNCKIELSPYSDELMNDKLTSWIDWYREQEKLDPSIFKNTKTVQCDNQNKISNNDNKNLKSKKISATFAVNSDNRTQICRKCDGFGVDKNSTLKCSACNGSGWMSYSEYKSMINKIDFERRQKNMTEKINYENKKIIEENKNWNKSKTICPNCGGDGGATGHCYKCQGTGWVIAK